MLLDEAIVRNFIKNHLTSLSSYAGKMRSTDERSNDLSRLRESFDEDQFSKNYESNDETDIFASKYA